MGTGNRRVYMAGVDARPIPPRTSPQARAALPCPPFSASRTAGGLNADGGVGSSVCRISEFPACANEFHRDLRVVDVLAAALLPFRRPLGEVRLKVAHEVLLITRPAYTTELGAAYCGDALRLLEELDDESVSLVMTSPPFALQRKKEYGNESQDEYVDWLLQFGRAAMPKLRKDGSLVIDIGGAYQKGVPVRSLYPFASCSDSAMKSATTWPKTSIGSTHPSFRVPSSG